MTNKAKTCCPFFNNVSSFLFKKVTEGFQDILPYDRVHVLDLNPSILVMFSQIKLFHSYTLHPMIIQFFVFPYFHEGNYFAAALFCDLRDLSSKFLMRLVS